MSRIYEDAKEQYASIGVDTDEAFRKLNDLTISLHCWQADDVGGFETQEAVVSGGGIQATGNYPGKARNIDELRQDIDMAMHLIPGKQKVNLHAIYGEFQGKQVDRDNVAPEHFAGW